MNLYLLQNYSMGITPSFNFSGYKSTPSSFSCIYKTVSYCNKIKFFCTEVVRGKGADCAKKLRGVKM